nr:hypothetical transcript [Hymenolepis microstoma]CUU97845.1 hypothetical transcript [Hymenolepis microstoma]
MTSPNSVHLERTAEEMRKQREKRKKYRKAKGKKRLKRKLAETSNPVLSTTNAVPAAVVSENGLSISGGGDVEQANIDRPAAPLLLDSKCAKSKESSDDESSTINNLSSSTVCRSKLHESKASDDNVNTEEEEGFEVEPKGKSRKRRAQVEKQPRNQRTELR